MDIKKLLEDKGNVIVAVSIDDLLAVISELIPAPEVQAEPEFYTKKEVREMLDVSNVTLYTWNKSKYLPWIKQGSRIFYDKRAIDAFPGPKRRKINR